LAPTILGVYGILLMVGGLVGYLKAGSRPSLIAGPISGALALAAMVYAGRNPAGVWLGFALAAAMLVVFAVRFAKGRKFMPSGLLALVSLGVLVALGVMGS